MGISYEVYRATIVLYGRPDLLTSFPVLGSMIGVGGAITLLVQVCKAIPLAPSKRLTALADILLAAAVQGPPQTMVPHRSRMHHSVDLALLRQYLSLGTRG